ELAARGERERAREGHALDAARDLLDAEEPLRERDLRAEGRRSLRRERRQAEGRERRARSPQERILGLEHLERPRAFERSERVAAPAQGELGRREAAEERLLAERQLLDAHACRAELARVLAALDAPRALEPSAGESRLEAAPAHSPQGDIDDGGRVRDGERLDDEARRLAGARELPVGERARDGEVERRRALGPREEAACEDPRLDRIREGERARDLRAGEVVLRGEAEVRGEARGRRRDRGVEPPREVGLDRQLARDLRAPRHGERARARESDERVEQARADSLAPEDRARRAV